MTDFKSAHAITTHELEDAKAVILSHLLSCGMEIEMADIATVGSVAMGVHLPTSDLDFAIAADRPLADIETSLKAFMEFRGERPATRASTRLLFSTRIDHRHVDLNVMETADMARMLGDLARAALTLSEQEKEGIVRRKRCLRDMGCSKELDEYKLRLYERFCPTFLWLPDYEIVKFVAEGFTARNEPIPPWLSQKLTD